MNKLKHVALFTTDPEATAKFYQEASGLEKVGETDSTLARGVFLSDGVINLALLNYKSDEAAGEDRGKDYVGLHHIGFWIDDEVDVVKQQIEKAGGKYYMGEVPNKSNSFYEVKFRDPNGVIIDVTKVGWAGASKDSTHESSGPELRHPGLKARRS